MGDGRVRFVIRGSEVDEPERFGSSTAFDPPTRDPKEPQFKAGSAKHEMSSELSPGHPESAPRPQ